MNSDLQQQLIDSTLGAVMATSKAPTSPSFPGSRTSTSMRSGRQSSEGRPSTALSTTRPSLTPPPGLLSLLSLGTQHQIGRSSRFRAGDAGRPDFLLTTALSGGQQVLHFRAARADDLPAIAAMAQRSGAATTFDLALQPGQHRYPDDYARSLYWNWSSWFHYPSSVILVAEIANAVGAGSGKVRREVVAVVGTNWRGKARKRDSISGDRTYAGVNRIQIKALLNQHLSTLRYSLALRFDRSRSKSQERVLDEAPVNIHPESETGFDATGVGVDVSCGNFETKPDLWYCYDLIVDPGHNGRGIGGRLLSLVTAAAQARHETLILTAAPGTEEFYKKQGFVRFGETNANGAEWVEMYFRQEEPAPEKENEKGGGERRAAETDAASVEMQARQ